MKPEQLQAIRERVNKATPGPWAPYWEGEVDFFGSPDGALLFDASSIVRDDAEFIAHAREDVPALLDYADSLIKENERFRGALEFIQKHRMMVGEIAYIAARNALGNEGKSYAQIYGGQDDPTVAAIKEHRQAVAGESE